MSEDNPQEKEETFLEKNSKTVGGVLMLFLIVGSAILGKKWQSTM